MSRINELLKDKDYITALLNGPCVPKGEEKPFRPINSEWLDMEASAAVTEAFQRLLPENVPYITSVIVERNPDTLYDGVCVDDNDKRLRYVVVTVVPDAEYPFNHSYPLIHTMWIVELSCWETVRATLAACRNDMYVRIATQPMPPILNNARMEWASLYLGRRRYDGIFKLSQQRAEGDEESGLESDVHLYEVREMEDDPLLQRLVEAYDYDYPEEGDPD